MTIVRTVTGDVEAGQLGPTTMHEHIFGDFTVWQEDPKQTASLARVAVDASARVEMSILGVIHRNPVVIRDNLRIGDDEALALTEVRKFADAGGDCLVEVTCCGDVAADGVTNMGRNAAGLRRIAEQTGLKIVAGTGFYLEGTHPDYVRTDSVEALAARMIRDLSEGIGGTGIRAGIIGEIGTSTVTKREQKVLRACARAHRATGAAISLHTHVGCPTGEHSVQLLLRRSRRQPDHRRAHGRKPGLLRARAGPPRLPPPRRGPGGLRPIRRLRRRVVLQPEPRTDGRRARLSRSNSDHRGAPGPDPARARRLAEELLQTLRRPWVRPPIHRRQGTAHPGRGDRGPVPADPHRQPAAGPGSPGVLTGLPATRDVVQPSSQSSVRGLPIMCGCHGGHLAPCCRADRRVGAPY